MALLFQSNPNQWDLRKYLQPGGRASWFVNRYLNYMKPGTVTLFWEAQGQEKYAIRGLYGWGIVEAEPAEDVNGKLRVPLTYIERWVSSHDAEYSVPVSEHIAAIPADEVLALRSWRDHLLARMPVGTNFIVSGEQMIELSKIVLKKYPSSAFEKATATAREGKRLKTEEFVAQRVMEVHYG